MILLAGLGKRVPAIAQALELTETTVRTWLKRFNDAGLDGLPAPRQLNQPFACWTLARLAPYLTEEQPMASKRSRLDAWLMAEGLRWRPQATGCGERVDPECAKKRGALQHSPPRPLSIGQ